MSLELVDRRQRAAVLAALGAECRRLPRGRRLDRGLGRAIAVRICGNDRDQLPN